MNVFFSLGESEIPWRRRGIIACSSYRLTVCKRKGPPNFHSVKNVYLKNTTKRKGNMSIFFNNVIRYKRCFETSILRRFLNGGE